MYTTQLGTDGFGNMHVMASQDDNSIQQIFIYNHTPEDAEVVADFTNFLNSQGISVN